MRSDWVPVSAAALVTGVMALVLAQMLNPSGPNASPADQLIVASANPGRWLAMSVLFFGGAVSLILGMPAVLTLFDSARGRGLGLVGVVVFTVGCVGVAAMAALMLMFRALALEALSSDRVEGTELLLVSASLENTGLKVMLTLWGWGFLAGVLLIALGLLRSKATAAWVPGLILLFLAEQVVLPVVHADSAEKVVASLGLMLLAAGFTGVAMAATAPERRVRVVGTLRRPVAS